MKFFLPTLIALFHFSCVAQKAPSFQVIAFFTAKNDKAHISFVREAHAWFAARAREYDFRYDTTSDWNGMTDENLRRYQVVIFLDTRPDAVHQREVFERYMKSGGGWMGFHFAAFALTPSAYPQNWNWYHEDFLGAGQYVSNTWRPTSATLKVENNGHPSTKGLPTRFKSSPNEWYRWEHDLQKNKNISILLSIHPESFPLGTGPKQHEIWHAGYYPVAWTNKQYRMIYLNMGHNDIDYDGGTGRELSQTFGNPVQDKLVRNALLWLGRVRN